MHQIYIHKELGSPQDRAIQNLLEQNPENQSEWDTARFLLMRPNKAHFLIRNSKNISNQYSHSLIHQKLSSTNSSIFRETKDRFPKMRKSNSVIEQNSSKFYSQKNQQRGFSHPNQKQYRANRGEDFKIAAYNTQYKWIALQRKSRGSQILMSSVRVDSFCPQSNTDQSINFNNFIGSNKPKNVKIRQFLSKMNKGKHKKQKQQGSYQSFPKFASTNDSYDSNGRIIELKNTTVQSFFQYSPKKIRQKHKPRRISKMEPTNAQIVGFSYFKQP